MFKFTITTVMSAVSDTHGPTTLITKNTTAPIDLHTTDMHTTGLLNQFTIIVNIESRAMPTDVITNKH